MKKDPPDKKSKAPIYVSDPKDPRLKAYEDSSLLYNNGLRVDKKLREGLSASAAFELGDEVRKENEGARKRLETLNGELPAYKKGESIWYDYFIGRGNAHLYTKPVQPIIYQPEKKPAPTEKVDVYKEPTQPAKKKPIYVTDPKDPRLKAYKDSLYVHNAVSEYNKVIAEAVKKSDPSYIDVWEEKERKGGKLERNLEEIFKRNPTWRTEVDKTPDKFPILNLKYPSGKSHFVTQTDFKEPVQPVELQELTPMQPKRPVLRQNAMKDESLSTVPVQNAITYPKDVRRYTAGQYLESQGKSSGYLNFGKNKGREEMKKYQFGGGLNYTGFTSSFTPSSDPAVADPARYRTSGGQSSGSGTGSTLANFGIAAVGAAIKGVETGIGAQASVDAIKKAKTDRSLSKFEQGQKRALELPRTGYYGYGYPKKMQSGGYGNSGGTTYDPALAGMDPDQVERGGQRAITEGTTEAVVSAIPVVGQIIGAATGAVKGVQSAAGKERMMVDGKTIDAYPDSTAAGVGNAMKMFTPHQSGFDHAENKDYGRAVLSWTGLGVIPDMIEGMSDQEAAERERIKNKVTSNVGGTSSASGTTYQRGSHVQMKYGGTSRPNAELEGGEVVEKNSGKDIDVKGPSHENGGVPKKLAEGDYVWSDHLKYQGKSMADWYKELKDSKAGEVEIEQLRALQEQLAGRTPQMKDGGTVPKYQVGGYRLPTRTQPGFNMFGQYRDNPELGEGMKGVPVPKSYVQKVKEKTVEPKPVKKKVVEEPKGYDPLGDYATVNGPGLGFQMPTPAPKMPRPDIEHLSTNDQGHPLDGYPGSPTSSNVEDPTGERSKAGRFFKQYGAYGIPLAGAMAQLIANGTSEFGDVKVPKAPKITTEKQFLSRATSDAEEAAADRDYKAALDYAAKSGTGPAQQAAAQTAYEDKRSANERTRERTAEINIQQDAKEKGMNLEADLRTKMANAEFEAQRNATLYDRDMAKAEFNWNKGMNVGNIIAGAARDTMSYIGDERHAKAIYGKEGIQDRKYGYSEEMLRKNLKGMGLSDAAIEAAVAKDRLDYQSKNKQGTKA
jgi:hypothetical protein